MNELSVLYLYVADWKLFGVFCQHGKRTCSDLQRYFGDMSQNRVAFSAILNVCLSALLDWGHIVQHLTGLSPRCWAELKSLWQLCTSMGTPTRGEFSEEQHITCMETVPELRVRSPGSSSSRTDLKKVGVLVRPSIVSHQKS